jgi:gluconate 2-dehydrogenase gamma chain
MSKLSRRNFFKAAGAAAAAISTQANVLAAPAQHHGPAKSPHDHTHEQAYDGYSFFQPDEAAFIEAAIDRLIPPDETGPSATEAGVQFYLDKQLNGAWGAGERLYRSGPWQQGTPTQGYQLPFIPSELFRTALRGLNADVKRRHGGALAALSAADQDAYLKSLQSNPIDLQGVPSNVFFDSLLSLTIEGYFSDPVYGGNKDMAAWKMIGFPGAYANYYELVDQHGLAYDRPPISLADNGRGVIKIHPNIPASIK